ncbi:MAG: hypothetical protein JNK95_15045 [Candidatus Competibacter sp.]|nr:hypothetical protein [Candidatus Competibacter sp.]MDG4606731.1 hypothetical protein [Candidatus Contendobacter sp.]HRD48179.1 hypothetical protein [Candidatus Contendobacter sp.]
MKSRTTEQFRKALAGLPHQVRQAYRQFQCDPKHPNLRFKPVHTTLPVYSARIGKGCRTLGQKDEKGIIWLWVGSHADYDKLLVVLKFE